MRQFPLPYGVLLLRHETARIHHSTRRGGARMASRGAGGAGRPNTARWRADGICRNRSSGKGVARGVHPSGFGVWLDRGPKPAHGRPLGTRKYRSDAYIRKRVSQPAAGRDSNAFNAGDSRCKARDLDHPHCICGRCRPSWLRICREPVPAGRKRYGVRLAGSRFDGEQVA